VTTQKVQSLAALATTLETLRHAHPSQKIVQCHGVFDLLHIGHIRHFEAAKKLGDVLVVTVTPDRYVNKGPHRPAFTDTLRVEAIAALEFVDYVAINETPTAVEAIAALKPHIYVKGSEYSDASKDVTGKISEEAEAVQAVGGQIAFTDDIVFSSSTLLNRHLPVLSADLRAYLDTFKTRYTIEQIAAYLEKARPLKVLVVGETIIDEYQFCQAMGSSTKEPILSVQYQNTEKFAGGVLAVANHVANFCDTVGVLTMLGAQNTQQAFIENNLHPSIQRHFFYKEHSPTIVKRRFIETYLSQKLFQVYEINNDPLSTTQTDELCALLDHTLPAYDLVLVVDYGHRMLEAEAVNILINKAPFLVVNTQANAGNRGFNTISKYPRADFISLASHEIALEERNRSQDYHQMILNLRQKIACDRIFVTRGKKGILAYDARAGFSETPALAGQVVDRMGTGDAVISVAGLLVAQGAPLELAAFVGNAVGAQAVATLGHQRSIEPVALQKFMISLLK